LAYSLLGANVFSCQRFCCACWITAVSADVAVLELDVGLAVGCWRKFTSNSLAWVMPGS